MPHQVVGWRAEDRLRLGGTISDPRPRRSPGVKVPELAGCLARAPVRHDQWPDCRGVAARGQGARGQGARRLAARASPAKGGVSGLGMRVRKPGRWLVVEVRAMQSCPIVARLPAATRVQARPRNRRRSGRQTPTRRRGAELARWPRRAIACAGLFEMERDVAMNDARAVPAGHRRAAADWPGDPADAARRDLPRERDCLVLGCKNPGCRGRSGWHSSCKPGLGEFGFHPAPTAGEVRCLCSAR